MIYRIEGGIPPLVKLLDFTNKKVQRASAGALRTLAFKNDENKNRVVESPLNFLIIYVISEWSFIVKKDIFSKEAMIVSILIVFANITPYLCREICQGKDKGNLYLSPDWKHVILSCKKVFVMEFGFLGMGIQNTIYF